MLGVTPECLSQIYRAYDPEFIATSYQGVPNQLYTEAMGTEFVVKPFHGQPDWELLLVKLERYKRGYRRDIRRVVFKKLSFYQLLITDFWRLCAFILRKLGG